MIRWCLLGLLGWLKPKAWLIAENLCLRQQLTVALRQHPRPSLLNRDRRFWILFHRWFPGWRQVLLLAQPATVTRWHRKGWRAYWRWRSRTKRRPGRPQISLEVQALIRRIADENRLWGQKRIQAELAKLGYQVSARTVAKYMRRPSRPPSPTWRQFLKLHADAIWACDFLCVQTLTFQTLREPWGRF